MCVFVFVCKVQWCSGAVVLWYSGTVVQLKSIKLRPILNSACFFKTHLFLPIKNGLICTNLHCFASLLLVVFIQLPIVAGQVFDRILVDKTATPIPEILLLARYYVLYCNTVLVATTVGATV